MTQPDLFQKDPISSQVDIHVNHSQRVVKGEAQKTLATSFRTCINLLNKSDPLIVFSEMFMDTSLGLDEVLFAMEKHQLPHEDICTSV